MSMGMTSARHARDVESIAETVLALEALGAAQALDLRAPLEPGPATRAVHRAIRARVPFFEADREFGADIAEFIAVGTAVVAEPDAGGGGVSNWRNNKGMPFTSDLSGQDFWTLIRAGYAPLGMVMGSCVYHIAHQKFGSKMGNIGRNVELEQFTQALYDARELAMSRMQAEAEQYEAEGIVGVQLLSLPHRWGGHTTEFFAIGTAVRPLRADHVIAKPQLVLPLSDNP